MLPFFFCYIYEQILQNFRSLRLMHQAWILLKKDEKSRSLHRRWIWWGNHDLFSSSSLHVSSVLFFSREVRFCNNDRRGNVVATTNFTFAISPTRKNAKWRKSDIEQQMHSRSPRYKYLFYSERKDAQNVVDTFLVLLVLIPSADFFCRQKSPKKPGNTSSYIGGKVPLINGA